ncbi:unnamed protein product [Arabidopsis lyrata]|uniref:Predicted protein n=1 Tax=Arabidopsis lyrata subsp. lyrata TaxID=81972 RepID=D7M0Y6_ARALL|nr:uncharacterized protein LOC9310143 isoform X1 [Arabidopsis lyrata subsp. lyrata]EFH48266.1 predicted protein [Arabidopsis lyrata subsp. lyrata]CAH8271878.1 unnamed protein product [Arabidopsis lyrata]|eukprot:XP_002872007.1 uncharacterized protein LOC9310143 isoform X1 [Arabidopsis lyrata subsp. lyrata]
MKMMLFTVLGSFIVGASLLLLLLFLIYLLRELCYEGIEVYKEARGEEEHLISPSISDESEYQCAQSAEQVCIVSVDQSDPGVAYTSITTAWRLPSLRNEYNAVDDFVLGGQKDSDSD